MNKCLQCNKDIGIKATYCSDKCRMQYKRATRTDEPEQTQPEHEQTTPNTATRTEQGKCHGCGKDVKPYICICYECFKQGITHATLGLNIANCS